MTNKPLKIDHTIKDKPFKPTMQEHRSKGLWKVKYRDPELYAPLLKNRNTENHLYRRDVRAARVLEVYSELKSIRKTAEAFQCSPSTILMRLKQAKNEDI